MAVTDDTGALLYAYDYGSYGEIIQTYNSAGGAAPTDDIHLTGKNLDPVTGLYYFNARWYDPDTGRFISATPLSPDDEHPYVLCENNTINYGDATGLCVSGSGLDIPWETMAPGSPATRFVADTAVGATPFVGSGRDFYRSVRDGEYGWAALHAGLFVTDVFLLKAMATGIIKGGAKVAGKEAAEELIEAGVKGGDDLVDLYRAVSPDELADIQKTGKFNPAPCGSEGKYFTPSGQEASTYAKEAVTNFGDAPYTIVHTRAPRSLVEAAKASATVEKGIRAIVIPNESLDNLVPIILNYSPLP